MNYRTFALTAAVIFAAVAYQSRGDAAARGVSLALVLSAKSWLNGRATAEDLTGKVVILDVFTVDCYNCQNVVSTLRSLYAADRTRGLAIVGIHAPETPAERERTYVSQSLQRQRIVWPVAVDNRFALWNAYGVTAWPTQLVFDRHGLLRATIVGDSQDATVRTTVASLLAEK
ncbi:MAG TPA: thioredoxin-like domain-containing protein [Candidatus Baltobacteraceae bacterium]|nr:thioredoxin-like domain-containing protein [Candidatus Baltobacteraceae bacterium]